MLLAEDTGLELGQVEREDWPPCEWIPVERLKVDPSYQRDLLPDQVKRIAKEFDLARFQIPEVARLDDGDNNVLDGQQRVAAVKAYNEQALGPAIFELYCRVHHGLTLKEQARLFVQLNTNRVRVGPVEQWKPRLLFAEPIATGIQGEMDKYGWEVGKGPDKIGAPASLEDIYTAYQRRERARITSLRDGVDALQKAFMVIDHSWDLHKDRFRGDTLAGVGMFFHKFTDEEIDYATLAETMRKVSPTMMNQDAVKLVTHSYGLESRRSANAKTLAEAYNRQAKQDGVALLPIKERFRDR